MGKYALIGILFCSSFCFSQTENRKVAKDSLIWIDLTCEKGSKEAETDFKKGIYNKYYYGLFAEIAPNADEGFNEFYKEYVRKEYSINIESKGCIVSDYSGCYSNIINKLILEKFGKNVFKKARKEALILFTKNKK